MDLRVTVGQLVERTDQHSKQIAEIKDDVKTTRSLLERLMRSSIVGLWFLMASILNWNPQKIAEFLAALKGLR